MTIGTIRASRGDDVHRWIGTLLGVVFGLVYAWLGPVQQDVDSHYPIAQAFLAGRLHLVEDYPWLELVPRPEGGWYSPFPPLLSILLVPFAALRVPIDTGLLAALFGGLSIALLWSLLGRLIEDRRIALALTLAWAVGSEVLWVAGSGGQHLAPQIAAAALLIAVLILGIDRRWPLLAGVLLGAAVGARLPVGLALPLILWLYRPVGARPEDARRLVGRRAGWISVLVGLAIPLSLLAAYDLARFGNPFELGYGLIRNVAGESVLDEPWYPHGIVSILYLPQGLYTMLLRGPVLEEAYPWIRDDLGGVSILLTMPILWWVFGAWGRLALLTGLTAVLVLIPDLLHGNPGFAQVGYRFILDALPLLWLLLALALRSGIPRAAGAALVAGIGVNVWLASVAWSELAL
jgi:hypothetical protein